MIVARTLQEFLQARAGFNDYSVALVPTMGALHEGHMALVKRAKELSHYCIVTIFVNQLQFDQQEDFTRYPKTEEQDIRLLEQHHVDLVWLPRVGDIYPKDFATHITVGGPSLLWEGEKRPGHFSGVATVVYRLFSLIKPHIACFGEKDWQQLQVIHRMVEDLNIPISIFGVPIVRETDGLAKSSRNRFLSQEDHQKSALLYKVLKRSHQRLLNGEVVAEVLQDAVQQLSDNGFEVDYFNAVDGQSLCRITEWQQNARLITAAKLGSVRLLDNI
ncbi:Panthothenate synthetase (PanC) (PDB:1DIN) (PUBMED:17968677) [Commensalibacter communis]|uniref:Pantothenate synthetase n=1 Tax=Commensalibacter communis TaxID=2972786 RepID=A0A9W4TLY1_9PROT|nr:pantoate--beta-alanine ligase [Commensalibacter communis]CAI3922151.1 Panthothenate synthetase (PanC) (PDB:1DIN) (PUBMED:17968677) [Commensalibacter communis]CAI3922785.1 Panthothenate synthetase (PanC) (PDB:1DIN) (PUBMED:17968677) [Commensalibacter communis]CAI3932084.1 Panthothenate synthetase (PanC) (PDB:1DIN) (PUBMED:17968677) [Commensalibacter communis]CAI3939826.1 Panthothenate synthetase (PanC) (PDB:1DIN) (PUBMED:17968677) [Commensalibacter communis]CAI3940416.1 Panthothenate synthet